MSSSSTKKDTDPISLLCEVIMESSLNGDKKKGKKKGRMSSKKRKRQLCASPNHHHDDIIPSSPSLHYLESPSSSSSLSTSFRDHPQSPQNGGEPKTSSSPSPSSSLPLSSIEHHHHLEKEYLDPQGIFSGDGSSSSISEFQIHYPSRKKSNEKILVLISLYKLENGEIFTLYLPDIPDEGEEMILVVVKECSSLCGSPLSSSSLLSTSSSSSSSSKLLPTMMKMREDSKDSMFKIVPKQDFTYIEGTEDGSYPIKNYSESVTLSPLIIRDENGNIKERIWMIVGNYIPKEPTLYPLRRIDTKNRISSFKPLIGRMKKYDNSDDNDDNDESLLAIDYSSSFCRQEEKK